MKNIRKRSKRNLFIGFGFTLLILVISSALSYLSIDQLLKSQKWVEHTIQVENRLTEITSTIKDAETAQRGFLLTSNEDFLEPYIGAKEEISSLFNQVELLTRDNNEQQKDLPLLESLIEHKFALISKTIADNRRGIPVTAAGLLKGKLVMDSVRTITNAMTTRESKLMISRNAKMNRFATLTPILICIAALIAMGISITYYVKVEKDADLAVILQKELLSKEEKKQRQISVIGDVAQKIAKGDYSVRIDKSDLE